MDANTGNNPHCPNLKALPVLLFFGSGPSKAYHSSADASNAFLPTHTVPIDPAYSVVLGMHGQTWTVMNPAGLGETWQASLQLRTQPHPALDVEDCLARKKKGLDFFALALQLEFHKGLAVQPTEDNSFIKSDFEETVHSRTMPRRIGMTSADHLPRLR
eukprot:1158904-Pelagomonas_calceolata.AAC.14